MLDHLVLDDRDCVAVSISQHKHSHIEAFAQKSAVEAFVGGCSQETYQEIDRTYLRHAHDLVQELIRAGASLPDADAILRRSAVAFSGEWYEGILRSNVMPLKAVLAGMSPRELAEFAEALVVLESLKERVTARTRSVGGPTSIAVITKSDGFRWVRRQEDYEPSTHSRFRHRTLQEYHA